jgi:hypothetical protein
MKITELQATSNRINLLIDQLKSELVEQERNKDSQLKNLKKMINDYSNENVLQFSSSYNVIRLKSIIHNLFEIIHRQDKRISELERK